jgi:site-specific DNA-methyltransferase (adenine-specific)
MTWRVDHGDALIELMKLEDASVDLVVTDPPYSSLEEHRAIGTTTRLTNDWFEVVDWEYLRTILIELRRVMKRNTHCYVLGNWDAVHGHLYPDAEAIGFKTWPPIIWDKIAIGMGYHWRRQEEYIAFFEKGHRNLNDLSWSSIQPAKRLAGKAAKYPTQKPTELLRRLILNSSQRGETVLDPFCGSGSTGVAALHEARHFIGFDSSEIAGELAIKSLGAICAR